MKRFEDWLLRINKVVLVTFMILMFLLVFLNVVTRYIFKFSLNWAEEISRYCMIWCAYLGMGLAMRENRHVAIEMLQDRVPAPVRRALRALNGVVLIAFMIALTALGVRYSVFAWDHETAALQWSLGLMYLTVPIGALMFILYMVTMWRDYVNMPPTSEQLAEAAPAEGEGA